MARYTGAVCKMCRREGKKLYLKGERCYSNKCAFERRSYAPGQHGQTGQPFRRAAGAKQGAHGQRGFDEQHRAQHHPRMAGIEHQRTAGGRIGAAGSLRARKGR